MKKHNKGALKRATAIFLATITMGSSIIPYLPSNLLTAYAFKIHFENSGVPGHPYLRGTVDGEAKETNLLCLNEGASCHSDYNYEKTDVNVSYSEGDLWQKRLFWAYIGAFGSYDGDPQINNFAYGICDKDDAKQVAWKNSCPAKVDEFANDKFMSLENVPDGCKDQQSLFDTTSKHATPETALSINDLWKGPGDLDMQKLYDMMGLKDYETLKKYCTITPVNVPDGYICNVTFDDARRVFEYDILKSNGATPQGKDVPTITLEVKYDPSVFTIYDVSGTIEYFECKEWGSQQLTRVKGHLEVKHPVFYITTGKGGTSTPPTPPPDDHIKIDVPTPKIYEHKETFESNYEVDLTKYDYETGKELKDSTWQVLEAFPDQTQLSDSEEDGGLLEKKMREAPTTWNEWLIFETDLKTDTNGYLKHHDTRYYDFDQMYCNGHPKPQKPDLPEVDTSTPEGEKKQKELEEELESKWEAAQQEWQDMVDECAQKEANSHGAFHHWVNDSDGDGAEEPDEAKSFQESGCEESRDTTYDNFINLRYSYTFREEDPRDGYIIHGENGHPDDVPVEIITTAASEANKDAVWTKANNYDITVTGFARNMMRTNTDNNDSDDTDTYAAAETHKLYINEPVDLTIGQKAVNQLMYFFGLPEKYASEQQVVLNFTVSDDEKEKATPSNTKTKAKDESTEIIETSEENSAVNDAEETTAVENSAESIEETTAETVEETEAVAATDEENDTQEEIIVSDPETQDEEVSAEPEAVSDPEITVSSRRVPTVGTPQDEEETVEESETDDEEVLADETAVYSYEPLAIEAFKTDGVAVLAADDDDDDSSSGGIDFDNPSVDSQPGVDEGPHDRIAHSFKVYDHRVPGQIHFNKKDMDLKAGENADYDSYGDTQGDSTLEGAVYGLFAATDIYGPDTQRAEDGSVIKGTGVIFDANDLVAIATTDKNGDGSFLTITEKPHTIYDYKAGTTKYTGKDYPKNLYDMDGYRKVYQEEETGRIYQNNVAANGDYWIGQPLILGNYYIKELSRSEGYELSITGKDMTVSNVNDTTRAEYGESADSKSNPVGSAWVVEKLKNVVTNPEANATYGNRQNLFSMKVASLNATNGYNVVFSGIPEKADFYADNVTKTTTKVQVPVGYEFVNATEEPLYLTASSLTVKKDADGNPIPNPNAQKTLPVSAREYGYKAKLVGDNIDTPAQATMPDRYNAAVGDLEANDKEQFRYIKYEAESLLRAYGLTTPTTTSFTPSTIDEPVYDEASADKFGSPEVTFTVSNVSTCKDIIDKVVDYYLTSKIFSYGSVQGITMNGNTATVTIAANVTPMNTAVYQEDGSGNIIAGYLFRKNSATNRYTVRKYAADAITISDKSSTGSCTIEFLPDFELNDAGEPVDKMTYRSMEDQYLCYQPGDVLYDYCYADGTGHEKLHRKVLQTKYEEREVTNENTKTKTLPVVKSMEEVADPVGSTYVYYDADAKQYILHVGAKDTDLTGQKSAYFTVALDDGSTTLTADDIAKIGKSNVWNYKAGDSIRNSAYLMRIAGVGASVFACEDFDKDETFIRNARLIYNGYYDLCEDANTNEAPTSVEERIISQQIKVTKTIEKTSYNNTDSYSEVHEDWFTKTFGSLLGKDKAAQKLDNFRYKTYLKSNLERLFRDNDGNVIWLDRSGNEIDVLDRNQKFPALVNKIYTKVQHVTTPLYKDSEDAIVSNDALYSYTNGLINEDQNTGYTSILETVERTAENGNGVRTVQAYNYDKFFDAIAVANNDKWDDANPTYTSWQPIGNEANRTDDTIQNAKASDKVRQFAIDWYLDDEIAKLVKDVPTNGQEKEDKDGKVAYSDEMYDEALRNAITKAENYLKPFFSYDLDEIYAIAWDSAENGGSDNNQTTLSADTLNGDANLASEGYYFGTSKYLPYGTYVVVEQQPKYDNLEDFKNKHYQIDKPREVELPAVYASYDGSQESPEEYNSYYNYDANISQSEMERKYKIRFNEETLHRIKGRNAEGDFEVYKYGMDIDRINNGTKTPQAGDYFALTQDVFKPYKNYYNAQDDRTTGDVPYYLTEGLSGKEKVSKYYRYSSVAENAGTANDVAYPGGTKTEDNVPGIQYKDNVKTMQGVKTAYDGKYASMLVPWTVVASDNQTSEITDVAVSATGESSYKGFSYTKFRNRFFTTKLRIEKLDSETHENILHDGAIFNIYAAERDDSANGDGSVKFYDEPTLITGTEEFLESMGATDIKPMARRSSFTDRLTGKQYGAGNLYTGVVPAGTPICSEDEKIVLGDSYGTRTVAFKAYSTVLDGQMKSDADNATLTWQNQTVGYIETPQPLGAGVYVICESKAPSGYTRTKPIAIEVYSDKVTYYKQANKNNKVLAAMYEYPSDNQTANGTKPQDLINVARVDVENAPIKLTVEKLKESSVDSANTTTDKTVTYRVSGRIDGKLSEIGNNPDYEYAYSDAGEYLGYAWKKGTLEYLTERQKAGENVKIAYEGNVFAGYGYVTKTLGTADDANKYVAGATMTLFDALEITESGDTQDHKYNGLVIERDGNNNISRMHVEKGYAGRKVEFIEETDDEGKKYSIEYQAGVDKDGQPLTATGSIWTSEYIDRPDTDILYYDLDKLDIFTTQKADGLTTVYGYDRDHNKVVVNQVESDKNNFPKTDSEYSIYAFKGGIPYLEFVGGDFNQIKYSSTDKVIEVGDGTLVYHLDRDGNRDSLVDPYTGMAYVKENVVDANGKTSEKTLVWAVNVHRDEYGNVISTDKITTSRLATIGENKDGYNEGALIDVTNNSGHDIPDNEKPSYTHTESGYITGSWQSEHGEESHKETTVNTNDDGQNMNEDVLVDDNNGQFNKELNPTYDEHGLVGYYQRSGETYDKGTELYDRNGDFVRYQDSDNLEEYNNAAYRINEHDELYDGDETKESQNQSKLYHRQGEGYILENTWTTSDKTPNDPFDDTMTDGQADVLKRVPAGTYIMEELKAPSGYIKGMPTGITVNETAAMQNTKMVDKTTKIEISKIDGTEKNTYNLKNMETGLIEGTVEEGKNSYGYGQVSDAVIALYRAKKVYTADFLTYPKGYYLERASQTEGPITYYASDSMVSNIKKLTAQWTTGTTPIYAEGIPEGFYLLEELSAPDGFTISDPLEVYISNSAEVQDVTMYDDHTKVEIAKHEITNNGKEILPGAGFTLYKGNTDGTYNENDVVDSWTSDDATDYTETVNYADYPNANGATGITGFMTEFEEMFNTYGTKAGTNITWSVERKAERSSSSDNVWVMEDRTQIPVVDGVIKFPAGMSQEDMDGFQAAYNANTKNANVIKWLDTKSAAYVSHTQIDQATVDGSASTTNFPTAATMIYQTNDGQQIRIAAYERSADRSGRSYTFDYKFDYKKLDAINAYACSYLTATGHRRFDYLPVGSTYVLVETTVPEGYAKADDRVITVEKMKDVQYYSILNETTALRISKARTNADGSETWELAGAKLGLYKPNADGSFEQISENLIASWTTGEDGTYTEYDFVNGLIPNGYKMGDLKPHTIRGLENGTYYLAEIDAPDYYKTFAPMKIDYVGQNEIQIVRVLDEEVKGRLEIKKVDKNDDKPLSGVSFKVTGYRYGTGEIVYDATVSDTNGKILVTDLPVGEADENGIMTPYVYKVKEITPPDGYQTNGVTQTFQFAPDKNGVSYSYDDFAFETLTVTDEVTRVYITKRDFTNLKDDGIDGAFVNGAVLAVYELNGRNADDSYIYDEANPIAKWTTAADEGRHMIEGLIAGRTCLLKELQAPEGYNLMKPVVFTLAPSGRSIIAISNDLNTVNVNSITPDNAYLDTDNLDVDSIDSVTVIGRYVTKVETVVTDGAGTEIAQWINDGNEHILHREDGLSDDAIYTFTEYTTYSDGSRIVTDKTTKRVNFNEAGEVVLKTRTVGHTELAVSYADGTPIESFTPNKFIADKTIKNNVNPENPKITVKSNGSTNGDVLDPTQAVMNTVSYVNTANITTDITVEASVDDTVTIMGAENGEITGNTIKWVIKDVAPLHSGYVTFTTMIDQKRALSTSVTGTLSYNGKSVTSTKTVPIMQPNELTIFNELTGSGKDLYSDEKTDFRVKLYNSTGEELQGIYEYTGSQTGEIRSGEIITLAGNEFVTINPGNIYKNVRYKVERIEDGSQKVFTERNTEGYAPEETGAFAVFTRNVKDTSEREIFTKGGSYLLTETTFFTDDASMETNKLLFTLDEKTSISTVGGYDKQTEVHLSKTDITTGKELPGAHIVVKDKNGKTIDEWDSTDKPHVITGVLNPGESYTMTETGAPDGFAYSEDITFTVNEDGTVDKVVMQDKKTHVSVSKTDITTGNELPGAHLIIKDKNGNTVAEWTSTDKPYELVGILKAGESYTLIEEAAPDGYAYAEEINFTVSKDGSIDRVIMEDKPTHISISKTDITTDQELPGAHITIKDKNGKVVDEWTSTNESHEIVGKLIAGETYTMTEVGAPDGFAYSVDVEFTVSRDGSIDKVVMEDKPTHVNISKTDITTGDELPGAHITIKDKNGNVVDEWTSTDKPHEIVGKLVAGESYTMTEVGAPGGYGYAEDITFTVSKDGSIDTVVMEDKPTHVTISKVDLTTSAELPGAQLTIKDKDGNVVEEWTSTDKPHEIVGKLIAGETYTLTEITAPNGYRVAESITFTVNRDGSVTSVVMKDQRIPTGSSHRSYTHKETTEKKQPETRTVVLTKRNTDGGLVSGAEYGIYLDDGTLVTTGVTGDNGRIELQIEPGNYYVQEISSPSGYSLNHTKYPLTVAADGTTEGKVDMVDDFAIVAISKLDVATLEPLEGAVFTMFTMDGTPVATATSGPEGYAEFRKVLHGDYYIMETDAPEGYLLSPEKRYVSIDKFYTNAAPIIWYDSPDEYEIKTPPTGDNSPIIPVAVLLVLSIAGYCFYTKKSKKKEEN